MKKAVLLIALVFCAILMEAQTPSDSVGVYAVHGDTITPMAIADYDGTQISCGFMSAKAKLEFRGKTSPYHFKGAAKFRVYFGTPEPAQLRSMYMFTPNYSMKDFGVGQFEVKKDCRRLTTVKAAIFSSINAGAKRSKNVTCDTVELRPGLYEVTVSGAPGEYCIMHTYRGSGGYSGVFDFTIE